MTAKGVPVGNATVSFLPADGTKGEGGIGTTDADGRFTLTGSRRGDSGVVPGKYRVRVSRFMDRDGTVLRRTSSRPTTRTPSSPCRPRTPRPNPRWRSRSPRTAGR